LRGWSKSKAIALAACLLALAGGAAYALIVGLWSSAQQSAVGAERAKPRQAVAALGRIEPQS
jgi:hypothetical protein